MEWTTVRGRALSERREPRLKIPQEAEEVARDETRWVLAGMWPAAGTPTPSGQGAGSAGLSLHWGWSTQEWDKGEEWGGGQSGLGCVVVTGPDDPGL